MQHIETLNLLFSGTPQFRFNRLQNKLFLDIDWARDVDVGKYVVVECYRKLQPSSITLTGAVELVAGNTTVIGTGTKFDQEIVENDFVTFGSETLQVNKIESPTKVILSTPPSSSNASVTMTLEGLSDVWNDRWLKAYATAKIKYQWGSNLSKFVGIQLPGGVTLDGPTIKEEAKEELEKLEEQLYNASSMPSEIFIG